jgi:hypothetical protein
MPRTYLIFGDIENKLDVLCVECTISASANALTMFGVIITESGWAFSAASAPGCAVPASFIFKTP